MTTKRVILEMGSGADLHGGDYTKAARRAVEDALRHSSLSFIRTLGVDKEALEVNVTIGVQQPDKVDGEALKSAFPVGQVKVQSVLGGLDSHDEAAGDFAVIAAAAIEVRMPAR